MYIVRTIPLSRGIFKEELSYFSAKRIPEGMLVTVPVQKRKVPALVIANDDARNEKAALRSKSYQMKKIESVSGVELFPDTFIHAAKETARYFATTTGEVIQALTPKAILQNPPEPTEEAPKERSARKKKAHESEPAPVQMPYILQADDEERFSTYKSVVREEFARNASVFFCVPTVQDIERLSDSLERGIKEYTYILHGGLTKKKLTETWEKALAEDHPVLIIATGTFFSIPRTDIGTAIVDREHAGSYKLMSRPFIDVRTFAEHYARSYGVRLIFGDLFCRTETLWRYYQGELLEFISPKFRLLSSGTTQLIDMSSYKRSDEKVEFRMISDELHEMLKTAHAEHQNSVLLCSRRGLNPITVCNDCGHTVTCTECSAPLVLHSAGKGRNIFLCHMCGSRYSADTTCAHCDSWRLTPLGIGTERVVQEIELNHPEMPVFRLDSTTANTAKKAKRIIADFYNHPNGILVGTEMLLYYLDGTINNGAVVSLDSLFTLPDFRITERIFNTLLRLRAHVNTAFLLQTRRPDTPVFSYALQGNLIEFYRSEIETRQTFQYPPFSVLIKITVQGRARPTVKKQVEHITELIKDYDPLPYQSFIAQKKGTYQEHILIQLPRDQWVDETLLEKLRSLPPSIMVKVDPEALL